MILIILFLFLFNQSLYRPSSTPGDTVTNAAPTGEVNKELTLNNDIEDASERYKLKDLTR
jgi:hypothetical protein